MLITLAAIGLVALQVPPSPSEWVRDFLQGSDAESARAREKLFARGPKSLVWLTQAREPGVSLRRAGALDDLIFDLKYAASDPAGRATLEKLRTIRVTVDLQRAPVTAALDYLRDITFLNLVLAPDWDAAVGEVTLKVQDAPLQKVLDAVCAPLGADYDVRYGVLFFAPRKSLWTPAREVASRPLTQDEIQAARAWISELGSDSLATRDRASAELRKLGSEVRPLLKETAGGSDLEAATRARELIGELVPNARRWGSLPEAGAWRAQTPQGADVEVSRKLERMKVDLAYENTKRDDLLDFLERASSLKIDGKAIRADLMPIMTLRVKDLSLGQALELLTLPLGLDFRLESGAVTIFERK